MLKHVMRISTLVATLVIGHVHANPLPSLHQAVIAGDLQKVKKLVESGADVNQLDSAMGNSPLHIAAQTDHDDILKYLLDKGAFINLQAPRSGFTPLMVAAWYSKEANIEMLFQYPELNINLKTRTGTTAADMIGGWDKHIEPHEAKLYNALSELFNQKHAELKHALAKQKILNVVEDSLLSEAQKVKRISLLIDYGQDVNQRRPVYSSRNDWHTPLLVAARDGYPKIVKLLLDNGADQTIPGYPMNAIAFHKAGYMGHPEIVELLLNAPKAKEVLNAQGPNNGYTPLHDAIWHGNTAAAKAFLQGGATTHLTTYESDTPLELAKRYQYRDIIQLLQNKSAL
ncbi:ankyrin repeat domain-containing protein [Pseudoalteromonas luteoviolacea]|uniref:ankyrin repeat domain-containing protein n=1 Tax=Pseudoalteromonas luteoviolacea TaxID=43657 RepID=UPI001B36CB77|nr:ankyrin repeat domain-containing protein [Pseudoalteromonas luteoviolacea]MBQ4810244.1 ankyrin repeat domain-containing protein [Pseudoalteromonas luteoviolacea]